MEIIKAGNDTIIVFLEKSEAETLLGGSPSPSETIAHSVIDLILYAGLARADDRLSCDLFESKDGGCEIFVTREARRKEDGKVKYTSDGRDTECGIGEWISPHPDRDGKYIYEFSDIEDMLGACRAMKVAGPTSPACALYDRERDVFYLDLASDSPIPGEFSGRKTGKDRRVIKERCTVVSNDAVAILSEFAL